MHDMNEFEKDKSIDPNQLDVECVKQADLFFKWAERLVEAKNKVDRAKFRLEVTEATLAIRIRQTPTNYSLEKITDKGVNDVLHSHSRYIKVYKVWLEARSEVTWLEKAVEAMEMKKRMLESLITLHGQQYFAGPSTPRNLVRAYHDHMKKSEEELLEKQRKETRKKCH